MAAGSAPRRAAVGPLRRRGEPDELPRLEPRQQVVVALRGGVMDLVHDHVVEVLGGEVPGASRDWMEAKTWRPSSGRSPSTQSSPKSCRSKHLAEHAPRLLQDLPAMGDEEKRVDLARVAEASGSRRPR